MLSTRLSLLVFCSINLDLVAQFRGFLPVVALLKIKQRVRGNDRMDLT